MKHKRETGDRNAMLALTQRRHRVHRVERERSERMSVCLFVCLFTYSLDRTKQIDRYRSILIVRITSQSNQQQQRWHQRWPHQQQWRRRPQQQHQRRRRKITMVGWKKKILRFILEEMKIMAKMKAKKVKHEESCVVQNDVQLYTNAVQPSTGRWQCLYMRDCFVDTHLLLKENR